MARGFQATLGSGNSDRVRVTSYSAIDNFNSYSILFLFYPRITTGTSKALVRKWSSATAGRHWFLSFEGNNNILKFEDFAWGTTPGIWTVPEPSTGVWHHCALVYDPSAGTGADPNIYIDNSLQSETETSTPAGTYASSGLTDDFQVGNIRTNNAGFDGMIAEVAYFDRLLSASEVASSYRGSLNRKFGPKLDMPLWGLNSPEPNFASPSDTGVVVGTAQQNHPPITPFTLSMFTPAMPVIEAAAGRTTKNTRSHPLGQNIGMARRMVG